MGLFSSLDSTSLANALAAVGKPLLDDELAKVMANLQASEATALLYIKDLIETHSIVITFVAK